MDKVTKLNITDYNVIVKATSKYPEITVDKSEEYLKYLHSNLVASKAELYYAREVLRNAENNYQKVKEEFNKLAELFDIEYDTITKEHITHNVNLGIQGMGNDILGEMK